jgi:molecular chaperone GrpE (heat shock protein)
MSTPTPRTDRAWNVHGDIAEAAWSLARKLERELAHERETSRLLRVAMDVRDEGYTEMRKLIALRDMMSERDAAEAELAAERARMADLVADLNDACITLESAKNDCDDYAMQNTAFKLMAVSNVLLQYIPNAAMKGGAK